MGTQPFPNHLVATWKFSALAYGVQIGNRDLQQAMIKDLQGLGYNVIVHNTAGDPTPQTAVQYQAPPESPGPSSSRTGVQPEVVRNWPCLSCKQPLYQCACTGLDCRAGCGAKIHFVQTPRGKKMPCDKDGTPHWTTCPNAEDFRNR